MTLDQLHIVQTIVEAGGFRAASAKLHLTQSAVSQAVKKLEENLGFPIFSREGYRPTLTPQGQTIYEKSKTLLRNADDLKLTASLLAAGEEAQLTIAVNSVVPFDQISAWVKRCRDEYPHTRFIIEKHNLQGSNEKLLKNAVDLAFTEVRHPRSQLEFCPISKVHFLAVAAPSVPLVHLKRKLTEDDLADFVQILVKDSSQGKASSVGVLDTVRHWYVDDFEIRKHLMMEGLGWGRMPVHLIQRELDAGLLVPFDVLSDPNLEVNIMIARRNDIPHGPVSTFFWDMCVAS